MKPLLPAVLPLALISSSLGQNDSTPVQPPAAQPPKVNTKPAECVIENQVFLRRKLRFLAVSGFMPIAFDNLTQAQGDALKTSGGTARNQRSSSNLAGGMGGDGAALGDPTVNSAPESLLVGRTLLVADNITNSIVAQGPPSDLEIIRRLLDQYDVKPKSLPPDSRAGQ